MNKVIILILMKKKAYYIGKIQHLEDLRFQWK